VSLPSVIPDSYKVPGAYLKVSLGVGSRSAADAPVTVCVTGNMTSAGNATPEQAVPVFTPDDAITMFGPGSELARMIAKMFLAFPSVSLHACPITESVGTAATMTITFSGTASGAGSVSVTIGHETVVAAVAAGDSAAVVGANVVVALNKNTALGVTAAGTTTVTFTAKHKGPRGNYIAISALKSDAAGITMTGPASAYLTNGATMDSPVAALDAISTVRFNFIVTPYQTSTELLLYKTHVVTHAAPLDGKRQQFIGANILSLASAIAISDAVNESRGQIVWHYNGLDTPAEIAATMAAVRADKIGQTRRFNLDGIILPNIAPQTNIPDYPTANEQNSALNSGLTPLAPAFGEEAIVSSITNHHLDASAGADFSVYDTTKVDVPDFIADDIAGAFFVDFANSGLAPDVDDEDPTPGIVTPKIALDWLYGRFLDNYERDLHLVKNVELRKAEFVVTISTTAVGRLVASVPCDVIDLLHQLAADVRQVG
jgi:phage tail sheath gpL-like